MLRSRSDRYGAWAFVVLLVAITMGVPYSTKPTVVLYGDSLAFQASTTFNFFVGQKANVDDAVTGGTAPCDFLPSMLGAAHSSNPPTAVAIEFSGNALTPCMTNYPAYTPAYFSKYYGDTSKAVNAFVSVGTHVFLMGAPQSLAGLFNPGWDRLNLMYAQMATSQPGSVTFVDAGAAVEAAGRFTWTLPCLPSEPCNGPAGTNVVRAPDGTHFCPTGQYWPCSTWASGAFRYGAAMAVPIIAALNQN